MKTRYLWIGLVLFCSAPAIAQTGNRPWNDPGDIEDAEIVIEKKREISLPAANRQYDKVPPLPQTGVPMALDYAFREFTYALSPLEPRIRPLTLADETLDKLYGNYVKAGFGNYITPYLQAYVGNKRNPTLAWNIQADHQSSQRGVVDSVNSGSSHNRLVLNTRSMGPKGTLRTSVGYDRQRVHYYGYPEGAAPIRDSIRQIYNRFFADLSIRPNGTNQDVYYQLDGGYRFQGDRFGAQEHLGGLGGRIRMPINDDFQAELGAEGWLSQRKDTTEQNRYFVRLQPIVHYRNGDLHVQGGLNVLFDNDTLSNTNPTYLYPLIKANYALSDAFSPYAKLWGNVEMVTWHSLTAENPWLDRDVQLNNTVVPIEFVLGGRGGVGSALYYDAGLAIGNVRNWYFYVPSTGDSTRFMPEYDQNNITRFNLFGELTVQAGEVFRGSMRADYFNYRRFDDTEQLIGAWHRPTAQVTALAQLNLADKLLIEVNGSILGGIQVPDATDPLPTIFNVTAEAEYRITQRLSVFTNFNNLANRSWERYQGYPTRQLMVIGGFSYGF